MQKSRPNYPVLTMTILQYELVNELILPCIFQSFPNGHKTAAVGHELFTGFPHNSTDQSVVIDLAALKIVTPDFLAPVSGRYLTLATLGRFSCCALLSLHTTVYPVGTCVMRTCWYAALTD